MQVKKIVAGYYSITTGGRTFQAESMESVTGDSGGGWVLSCEEPTHLGNEFIEVGLYDTLKDCKAVAFGRALDLNQAQEGAK